jgi:hypothetical protein
MGSLTWLTLAGGLLCTALGGMLILFRGAVDGALGFGIPIMLGGLILAALSARSALRARDAETLPTVPKRPGVWFPIGLAVILTLQAGFLIWWKVFGGK